MRVLSAHVSLPKLSKIISAVNVIYCYEVFIIILLCIVLLVKTVFILLFTFNKCLGVDKQFETL